jgi:hypothetical protein
MGMILIRRSAGIRITDPGRIMKKGGKSFFGATSG